MTGSFCGVLSRLGYVHCWITPFIRISSAAPRPARLKRRLAPFQETGLPVVAQIMGTESTVLAQTAARLAALGVAAVDLNCGCPSPTVVRSAAGGQRLTEPEWIRETLMTMRKAAPGCGVTVKLRSGFRTPDEMSEILPAVAEAAPDAVILHYRTVAEQYRRVDHGWRRLAQARDWLPEKIPLIGSGDLFTAEDALAMHRDTGVDGVAPARGLIRNPRLLRDIEVACVEGEAAAPEPVNPLEILRAIVRCSDHFPDGPPGFALELAGHMLGRTHERFTALTRCRTLRETARLLERFTRETEAVDDPQSGTQSSM